MMVPSAIEPPVSVALVPLVNEIVELTFCKFPVLVKLSIVVASISAGIGKI